MFACVLGGIVAGIRFRRTIIAVHRDFGYFFAALTVIYAVSGIAVNHVEDWNPNYTVSRVEYRVEGLDGLPNDEIGRVVLDALKIGEKPKASVRMSPNEYRIFLEGRTLQVAVPSGEVIDERIARRPGLFHVNFLHLNHAKGLWTWIADLYAVGLLTLALTGIFIIPGKKGLGGRGRWLLIAGTVLPLAFLVLAS